MKEKEMSFSLKSMHLNELDQETRLFIGKAVSYLDHAYAPYSHFYVGASVWLENGEIYGGANQENASYPLCMCGERVALYHASMACPGVDVKSIAITARKEKIKLDRPVMPCGACRQVILEYEERSGHPIKIYLKDDNDLVYIIDSVRDILPLSFDSSFL